eukprot:3736339-Alexandrium_andersonii.AAC.1
MERPGARSEADGVPRPSPPVQVERALCAEPAGSLRRLEPRMQRHGLATTDPVSEQENSHLDLRQVQPEALGAKCAA